MPTCRTALAAAALLLVSACSSGGSGSMSGDPTAAPTTSPTSAAPTDVVPGDDWATIDPVTAGFDPAALRALDRDQAAAGSSCVVVTRDGALVHEATFGDADRDSTGPAFSVTKSFTSVLVGIAADEGLLELDDRASAYVRAWRGTPAARVTIRDLLANVSGRHWDFATDYQQMAIAARDKTAFSIALAQDARPGTVWRYNNAAIQTLDEVLQVATGKNPREYAQEKLLGPLGMSRTSWSEDAAGNTLMFSGVDASCLDLARLGLLMMRDGRWDERQVVSSAYVEQATGRSSSPLNAAYGLLWWVNRKGPVHGARTASGAGADAGEAPTRSRLAPHAPKDAFWALGLGSQIVAVVPSDGIVAVRMGAAPQDPQALSADAFTADVLDAMR
ncbi:MULTISPECIES: serine hydrolase domain-containing protein [Mumia]|uniref:serine hydrolase domain-containing protein n=1 Tax=Mumia TaxID=1546255 RepID=UPI00142095AD|nr:MULTISPECIES: serine hydrolase domain-containing protein [unclassified Mumia]QMW65803.1 beta-lactamase family protein [Mumia sp. ZJ1417]